MRNVLSRGNCYCVEEAVLTGGEEIAGAGIGAM